MTIFSINWKNLDLFKIDIEPTGLTKRQGDQPSRFVRDKFRFLVSHPGIKIRPEMSRLCSYLYQLYRIQRIFENNDNAALTITKICEFYDWVLKNLTGRHLTTKSESNIYLPRSKTRQVSKISGFPRGHWH